MGQDFGDVLAVAARLALAAAFLFSALSKVLTVAALRDTLDRLGLPSSLARFTAPAVVAVEAVAAVGLVVAPRSPWPPVLVMALAAGFAAAGATTLVTRRRVACRCFGNVGRGLLGWRQLALLPLWLALAALALWRPPGWSGQQGVAVLGTVLIGLVAVQVPAVLRPLRRLQADRLAVASVYQADQVQREIPGEAGR